MIKYNTMFWAKPYMHVNLTLPKGSIKIGSYVVSLNSVSPGAKGEFGMSHILNVWSPFQQPT